MVCVFSILKDIPTTNMEATDQHHQALTDRSIVFQSPWRHQWTTVVRGLDGHPQSEPTHLGTTQVPWQMQL